MNAEQLAKMFHETYEDLAPDFGYGTRTDSRKPWCDVPEKNRNLMIAVAGKILPVLTPITRPQISADEINLTITQVQRKVRDRLDEKGRGIFVSRHEMLGIITEEYLELIVAVETGSMANLKDELVDITVAGIVSIASLKTGQVEW